MKNLVFIRNLNNGVLLNLDQIVSIERADANGHSIFITLNSGTIVEYSTGKANPADIINELVSRLDILIIGK